MRIPNTEQAHELVREGRALALLLVLEVHERIQVPALVITAADDPFVPPESFRDAAITGNPHVTLMITKHGGHCGFLAEPTSADDDGYWAERQIMEFAKRCVT